MTTVGPARPISSASKRARVSTALSYGAAMPRRYVALLRAVNVGGTGTLAMSDPIAICAGLTPLRIKDRAPQVLYLSIRGVDLKRE